MSGESGKEPNSSESSDCWKSASVRRRRPPMRWYASAWRMREDLRARVRIGMLHYGGRRLHRVLHDMVDSGEAMPTPDTVAAIALLPPLSYARAKPSGR